MENGNENPKLTNPVEKFDTKENFLNLKKEKILTLRKKKNHKRNIYRIIKEKEKKEEEKYNIYEFDKNEFIQIKSIYKTQNKNKNDIYKLSFQEIKSKNYNDEELKFWFYSMCKTSQAGKTESIKEKVLKNLTTEKIKYLIYILNDKTYFNTNINDINVLKNQIKFKYNSCLLIINLLYDTNKYTELIIDYIKDIYNFIYVLFDFYNISKDISFLILITHYQWLINNAIQDDWYNLLLKKTKDINFPLLIQNIFTINNPELYLNNIRMLIIFLTQQNDPKTFYQYNIFITDINNIINYSLKNNNSILIKDAYRALSILFKSEANCKLIIENKEYIKLLSMIVNGFNTFPSCNCCLSKLIKNDENNIINDNYQIYTNMFDIILNKSYIDKIVIKHALKIIRLIINNKNGFNLLNYIINNSFEKFVLKLQQLFFEKPHNLLLQSEIFNFYENFFNCANNTLKNKLLENNLHIFTLNCLEDSYEEFLKENKDNDCYNKLIKQMLSLLGTILQFGDNDLKVKINLKNCCEEKNIYNILIELNYCKNKDIQDLVEYLLRNFFEGYENDEYRENNDDFNEYND